MNFRNRAIYLIASGGVMVSKRRFLKLDIWQLANLHKWQYMAISKTYTSGNIWQLANLHK